MKNTKILTSFTLYFLTTYQYGHAQVMMRPYDKSILSKGGDPTMDVSRIPKPLNQLEQFTVQTQNKGKIYNFTNSLSKKRQDYFYGEEDNGSMINIIERTDENGRKLYTASIHDNEARVVTHISTDEDGNTVSRKRAYSEFKAEGDPIKVSTNKNEKKKKGDDVVLQRNLLGDFEPKRRLAQDDGSELDVMVLWSKRAECFITNKNNPKCNPSSTTKANMQALVELAIEQTNTAFEKSGIETSLRLVHTYRESNYEESDFDEDTIFTDTLDGLRKKRDGLLDEVHDLRSQYRADMVVMLIQETAWCGVATIGPAENLMFSVTQADCAVDNLSFAHEIGHTMGCLHDQGSEDACDETEEYSYGYRDPQGQWRTIMAIDCEDSGIKNECDENPSDDCPKILRFSTPDPQYAKNGRLVGSDNANNARVFNDNAFRVANYFQSQGPPPTQAPTPPTFCNNDSDCDDNDSCSIDTCQSGTCNYDLTCSICNKRNFLLNLQTDIYPEETLWRLKSADGDILLSDGPYDEPDLYSESICLEAGDYTFEIFDFQDDGICCTEFSDGYYEIYVDNTLIATGGEFEDVDKVPFTVQGPPPPTTCSSSSDCIPNDPCTIGTCQSGSCNYDVSCSACNKLEARVDLQTDTYNEETSWKITSSGGEVILRVEPYDVEGFYSESVCLDSGNYIFEITDTEEDGLCCGSPTDGYFKVYVDNSLVGEGSEFGSSETVPFTVAAPCAPCTTEVLIEINTDTYPEETTWKLTTSSNQNLISEGPYDTNEELYTQRTCLQSGNYNFKIFDSGDDGICCEYGNGSYKVKVDGNVAVSGGNFGADETVPFTVQVDCSPYPTVRAPTPYPTGPKPTPAPSPNQVPTPHPTGRQPTPYPTEKAPTPYPVANACSRKKEPCSSPSDCCVGKCNTKKGFCKKNP